MNKSTQHMLEMIKNRSAIKTGRLGPPDRMLTLEFQDEPQKELVICYDQQENNFLFVYPEEQTSYSYMEDFFSEYGEEEGDILYHFFKQLFESDEAKNMWRKDFEQRKSWREIYNKYQIKLNLSSLSEEQIAFIEKITLQGHVVSRNKDFLDSLILKIVFENDEFVLLKYNQYDFAFYIIENCSKLNWMDFFEFKNDNEKRLIRAYFAELFQGKEANKLEYAN